MIDLDTGITLAGGIISLFFLVYRPMHSNAMNVKENTMNTEANTKALDKFRTEIQEELKEIRKNQKESITELERKKHESHEKLWKHNEEQDKTLSEHSLRIRIIEKEVGINGKEK